MRRVEPVMGTLATVELREPYPAEAERLIAQAHDWFRDVDRRFSTFRPDSEISRLDRREVALADCSADVRYVLQECARLWRVTDGYFDVYASGQLDPSGYVKGWSVQVASERLSAAGAVNHFIEVGGDLQLRGHPEPGAEWVTGVRHPWQPDAVCWELGGTDVAIATSGTYERGAHVINPRTGRPAVEIRAVTIVGRDLAEADAFATAALAMGRPALEWLSTLEGFEAGVIFADETTFVSPGLPTRTRTEDGNVNDSLRL